MYRIGGATKVVVTLKKVQERRLRSYGPAKKRTITRGDKGAGNGGTGSKTRGRPKRRWMDCVRDNLRKRQLSVEDDYDRAKWR